MPRCPRDGFALVEARALAEADGDPFLGAVVGERYVVLARLGAGSMGTVYVARQEAMGRDVAVKILRGDRALDALAKARFVREARAMSLLSSPHTVTVFDFGELPPDPGADPLLAEPGSLYLVMELLEGESLGERLRRVGRLRVEEACRFARHALLSLAEAHDKGIVHRDLKPDNLFIVAPSAPGGEETCKVLDFGVAKMRLAGGAVDSLETQAGTVFGTPRYMSPEQARGLSLDARSDLYALGVLLYQMLVGRPPFVDDDAVVVMARHIKSPPVPPEEAAPEAGIPAPVSRLVLRAMAKERSERPPSALAFLAELDAALAEFRGAAAACQPGGAAGSGETPALVRDGDAVERAGSVANTARSARGARFWLGAGAAGALGLSVAVALAFALLRGPASRPPDPADLATPGSPAPAPRPSAPPFASPSAAPGPSGAAGNAPPEDVPLASAAPASPGSAAPAPKRAPRGAPSAGPRGKAREPKRAYSRFE